MEIVSLTNAETQARALDSCRAFERDVEVYDFHYRCDLAASSTDRKMILRIQLSADSVEFDNNLDYEVAIEDVVEIGYYIVMLILMLQKRVLKYLMFKHPVKIRRLYF